MLSLERISVEYYRRGQVIPAVRDVSLTIAPGETVGLVGESGSGKSTVALAILRLIRAQEGKITSGRILFQGQDLLSLPTERLREVRGKRISLIFQDPFTSLNPVMRIRDQMEEVLEAHHGATDSESQESLANGAVLEKALERVQLEPSRVLSGYPHQLSGGQRQRVMIATALLGRPELILADEPTTALDVLVQREVLSLLFRLQAELGFGLLFITHNIPLVAQHARRLIVMKSGSIVEEGTVADILRSPRTPYTRQLVEACRKIAVLTWLAIVSLSGGIATAEESMGAPSCEPGKTIAAVHHAFPPEVKTTILVEDSDPKTLPHVKTILFKGLTIDKIYPSMTGPWTRTYLNMTAQSQERTLWVTEYKADVLDGKNGSASQEFMCHTNMDLVVNEQGRKSYMRSLFSISQGQKEVVFPKGFALKMENNPNLVTDVNVMVLNNNYPDIQKQLDFRVRITYFENCEAIDRHLTPVFQKTISVFCPTGDPDKMAPGMTACEPAIPSSMHFKGENTGHWKVPPGVQTTFYDTPFGLGLDYDTTVHYIWMHVHPYARSIELVDKTTGQRVWKGNVQGDSKKALVVSTDRYSSAKGLPVYHDHKYQVIVIYNNTTSRNADAMAALWMYFAAKP